MVSRNTPDVIGGGILAAVGAVFTWYTIQSYDLGTPNQMGPGMFPAALGALLCLFGLLIIGQALITQSVFPPIRIRSPFFVLAGMAAFGLLIVPFGLIPAVLAVVVLSSFADNQLRPLGMAGLGVVMGIGSWLVFGVGLGLPVPMITWPN